MQDPDDGGQAQREPARGLDSAKLQQALAAAESDRSGEYRKAANDAVKAYFSA